MNDTKIFYVPPGWGRSAVVELIAEQGLVDLKASGNTSWNLNQVLEKVEEANRSSAHLVGVRKNDHISGLEIYNLATAEYLRQYEIQQDYDRRRVLNEDSS